MPHFVCIGAFPAPTCGAFVATWYLAMARVRAVSTRTLGKRHAGRGKEQGTVGKGAVRLPSILVLTYATVEPNSAVHMLFANTLQ